MRKLNEPRDYTTNAINSDTTDGVAVTSRSAGLLRKIGAATDCLHQIALKGNRTKRRCIKQDLPVHINPLQPKLYFNADVSHFRSIYIRRATKNWICRHFIFLTPCFWDIGCPQNRTLGFCISVTELLPIRSTFYTTKNIIYNTTLLFNMLVTQNFLCCEKEYAMNAQGDIT